MTALLQFPDRISLEGDFAGACSRCGKLVSQENVYRDEERGHIYCGAICADYERIDESLD